jgi:lambda family phage portal protein
MSARQFIYNALGGLANRLEQRGRERSQTQDRPRSRPAQRRSYTAAANTRLTADWKVSDITADEAVHRGLTQTRARSRDLARNNDYAKRYFSLVRTNTIGHQGIRLQVRAKNSNGDGFDKGANDLLEAAWKDWGKVGNCTTCGTKSWRDVQNLTVDSMARDGEFLIKFVAPWKHNKYGFALQLLEGDVIDIDKNEKLKSGSIRLGVQRDELERITHYWLKGKDGYSKPYPAREFIHLFRGDRADQSRGMPETATPAARLKQIDAHEEAHVIASRIGASKMGFFTSGDGDSYTGDDEDGEEGDRDIITEAEPGVFEQLPEGVNFQAWDPQFPVSTFADFEKAVLRGIASGLGVSYHSLANDLEGVNYSSIRQGELTDRNVWQDLQYWLVEHLCQPVYEAWLSMALLTQAVPLPFGKIEKFSAAVWRPRGWAWIDPLKESKAAENDVKNGFKSIYDVCAERGHDFDEIMEQNKRARDKAEAEGFTLPFWEVKPDAHQVDTGTNPGN